MTIDSHADHRRARAPHETVQVRRYRLNPDRLDEFVRGWSAQIPGLRARHGFRIPFAYLDRENATFVWAVAVDGGPDAFAAAEAAYYASPEKLAQAEPPADRPRTLLDIQSGIVEDVLAVEPVHHH